MTNAMRSKGDETGETAVAGDGRTVQESPVRYLCMKYNRHQEDGAIACQDPDLYCKFRPQCMIHYMEKRRRRQARDGGADDP